MDFDVTIIGAGVSGLYQLLRLRRLGLRVRVFEAGTDVGGTWYWNRYPGARFDSESYSYGYSFSQEILDEWEWSEHFAPQPETLRYLNFVADKFDLRSDIQFESKVASAVFDDESSTWTVTLENGASYTSRFFITAIGALSVPTMPSIDGVDRFGGEAWHTGYWPKEPVDFAGKRVAVIGTGATGVQVIQEVAKTAAHLTVLQRTANWCAPLLNSKITPEEQAEIKADYAQIFETCRNTFGGFIHEAEPRKALEVSEQERLEFFEQLYNTPGFGIWMANFRDVLVNDEANRLLSEFVADKIRQRVDDPTIAEKLIPDNHGFGTRRVPLETEYYEVYNQDNVDLVDIRETPILEINETGIRTAAGQIDVDLIVYATGFDAVLGPFNRLDIRGVGGQSLKEKWAHGPRTYLGLQTAGFPNMFTLVGPHNAATFCNMPRCIEQNVEWVSDLFGTMLARGITRVEATEQAEAEWTEHVHESGSRMLFTKVNSWFMGINSNVEGRQTRQFILYAGGLPQYRDRCDEVAADDYRGFALR